MSQEQWRLLNKEELPQRGDECCMPRDEWEPTGNVGRQQGSGLIYRRKIEQPKLVWSWTTPDKIGVWAYSSCKEDPNKTLIVIDIRSIDEQRTPSWWCYLGPIPTIELPAKKYREPELPKDYGKQCEFANNKQFIQTFCGRLCGYQRFDASDVHAWIAQHEQGTEYYRFARIEVTE